MRRTITRNFLIISLRRDIHRHPTLVTNFLTTLSIHRPYSLITYYFLATDDKNHKNTWKTTKIRICSQTWLASSTPLFHIFAPALKNLRDSSPSRLQRHPIPTDAELASRVVGSSAIHLMYDTTLTTRTFLLSADDDDDAFSTYAFLRGGTCFFVSCSREYNV